jgi:hypothetical protein
MLRAVDANERTRRWDDRPNGEPAATLLESAEKRTIPGDVFANEIIQLWFALRRRPWASLAVVPTQSDNSALALAMLLSELGTAHLGIEVELLDGTGPVLRDVRERVGRIQRRTSRGGLIVVGMGSLAEEPAGLPLVAAADACVLCVSLGDSKIAAARKTLDLIGRDRFLGYVTLRRPAPGVVRAVARAENVFFGRRT